MTTTALDRDEATIRELIADLAAARQDRDTDRIVARYAPDLVAFTLAPPLQADGAEARDTDALRSWLQGFDGPIEYEVRDLSVTAGADVAYCHSLNRLTATPQGRPDPFTLWFRATVCLRKTDGEWLVSHLHNSTPFYMDGSLRAAVDLQP